MLDLTIVFRESGARLRGIYNGIAYSDRDTKVLYGIAPSPARDAFFISSA